MSTPPIVFISYSHDSPEHRRRVLELAQRLRGDGVDARLDQYVSGTPSEKWPRWMLNQIEEAAYVLVICSPIYYQRFRGKTASGTGKGADWEGAIITQESYDSKGTTKKFVPGQFDRIVEDDIPEPLRGHTYYCVTDEGAYESLLEFFWGVAGVEAAPLGAPPESVRKKAGKLASSPVLSGERPEQIALTTLRNEEPAESTQGNTAPITLSSAPDNVSITLERQTDTDFMKHARQEMLGILERCPGLRAEIQKHLEHKNAKGFDLVAILEQAKLLERVVNDYLRPPTIAGLRGCQKGSDEFRHRWESARALLAWLAVLSVRDDWVRDFERKHNYFGVQIEIAVSTPFGVEIVSSRYRQRPVSLPQQSQLAKLPGADSFSLPLQPPSYDLQQCCDAIVLHIWQQVFPEDSRDKLSSEDLRLLDSELWTRTENRTWHHYFTFSSKDETPLNNQQVQQKLLATLPHLLIFRMSGSAGTSPLLVADEGRMLAVIRSFLQIAKDLQDGRI